MGVATRTIPTGQNPDLVSSGVLVEGKEIPKKYQLANISVITEINKIPTATLVLLEIQQFLATTLVFKVNVE